MTKNIIKYIVIIIAIAIVVGLFITIYSFAGKAQETTSTKDKIKQEIAYIDNKLISVINSLNNLDAESLIISNEIKINNENGGTSGSASSGDAKEGESNSENKSSTSEEQQNTQANITTVNPKSVLTRNKNDIDWQYINTALEEVNNAWTIINLDLRSIGVRVEELEKFSSNLDVVLKYTTVNDKQNSLISLANLYSVLPDYENGYLNDSKSIELKYLKSDIISTYALLDTDRWNEIYPLLNEAESRMAKLISITNNNTNMKRINIELKDYIKSVNDMDVNLCYMKYYYLIKDIENEE